MPITPAHSRSRWTLVFDGECGFCTAAVRWVEQKIPVPPPATPYQWADLEQLGLSRQEAAEMLWLVCSDSADSASSAGADRSDADRVGTGTTRAVRQYGGYLAISVLLRHQPRWRWRFLGILMDTPPFSLLANLGYRLVARLRRRLPGVTPACQVGREP